MQGERPEAIQIVCCYAPEDRDFLHALDKHLAPLKRMHKIATWDDRRILPGMDRANEIEAHLNAADIILLLVSPDFIASDFCYSTQMRKALERHGEGKAKVIPIILRPTLWREAPIGQLQSLPKNDQPVNQWPDSDAAFLDIVVDIWKTIKNIHKIETNTTLEIGSESKTKVGISLAILNTTIETIGVGIGVVMFFNVPLGITLGLSAIAAATSFAMLSFKGQVEVIDLGLANKLIKYIERNPKYTQALDASLDWAIVQLSRYRATRGQKKEVKTLK